MNDNKEQRIQFTNRFWEQAYKGSLPEKFDGTATAERIDKRLAEIEAEMREVRRERYEAKMAFEQVKYDNDARVRKMDSGVSDAVNNLVCEVYERAQQATKLQGQEYSGRHELPNAYAEVRTWHRLGKFGARWDWSDGAVKYDPLFIEKQLLTACMRVMYYDTTKKGKQLSERVYTARKETWERWVKAGEPCRIEQEVA